VDLAIDGALLSAAVGPRLHVVEIALSDPEWEGTLRAILEAVAAGQYEEHWRRGLLGNKLVMSFGTEPDRFEVAHFDLAGARDADQPSQTYAPY
jgi:hypothetical protein